MEPDNAFKIWITLKKRREAGINPPVDFALRPVQLEEPKNWQRLNDITEGTRLENENFQRAAGLPIARSDVGGSAG